MVFVYKACHYEWQFNCSWAEKKKWSSNRASTVTLPVFVYKACHYEWQFNRSWVGKKTWRTRMVTLLTLMPIMMAYSVGCASAKDNECPPKERFTMQQSETINLIVLQMAKSDIVHMLKILPPALYSFFFSLSFLKFHSLSYSYFVLFSPSFFLLCD